MNTPTTEAPSRTQGSGAPSTGTRRPGVLTVLRWEIIKLAAQARSRYILLGCLLAPVAIVLVFNGQQQTPKDTIFGRQGTHQRLHDAAVHPRVRQPMDLPAARVDRRR